MTETEGIARTTLVVLARLLVAPAKGVTAAAVAKDLSKLDAERFSVERVTAELQTLQARGLAEAVPPPSTKGRKVPAVAVTVDGRAAALSALRLSRLPSKLTWPTVVSEHLLPVAAGATPQSKPLKAKAALAAHLLRREFELDLPETAKLSAVIAAIVCKSLGFPAVSDYATLQARVLDELIPSSTPLPPKTAPEQFVRSRFKSKQGKADDLRRYAVRRWLGEPAVTATAPPGHGATDSDADLAEFARRALDAARRSETGWFGDNKVFISHAWRSFRARGDGNPALDLPQFKQQLLRANTAGLLQLSRADLVALMDPADVRESEARYLNTSFHFLLLERGRP